MSARARTERYSPLPKPEARGLSREEAAAYVGVSTSFFDRLVDDRRMPGPKRLGSRVVWDRLRLDAAFAALPDEGGAADEASGDDVWGDVAA